jgi:glyoxylase-like metal-dependent hydrolase (beta-lactamase superfamily II)
MSTSYLLPFSGGYLQIDTGYEKDYPAYRKALGKLDIDLRDIKYLFLTHHHDDHAGFLNEISRDCSLTIIAHEQAQALLMTGKNDKTHGGGYVNSFVKWIADLKMRLDPTWTLTFPPFEMRPDDIVIREDDDLILRQIGVAGRILYTPGHCIDHLAIVLDTGDVFCGDAAASFPLFAGIQYCPVFMTDMEEAYRSWQKILDAGAKVIYPAHGKPFPAKKLRKYMGKICPQDLVRFL